MGTPSVSSETPTSVNSSWWIGVRREDWSAVCAVELARMIDSPWGQKYQPNPSVDSWEIRRSRRLFEGRVDTASV